MKPSSRDFINANTVIGTPSILPELKIRVANEIVPLWHATETQLSENGISPPYWAFVWPGGQAIARYIIDNSHLVARRTVLDFAAGSGVAGLAALRAGATEVTASDVDPLAVEAIHMNADLNGLSISTTTEDLTAKMARNWDVVLAGDVCYEKAMADQVWAWLRRLAAQGVLVLLGDPGRNYKPAQGLVEVARYEVPTSLELEDKTVRSTGVWRVVS
jgi:predicted nicotinamide N-methyase